MKRILAGRSSPPQLSPDTARSFLNLSRWSVNAARRLSQLKRPGVYRLTFVVTSDGRRLLDVEGQAEELGY